MDAAVETGSETLRVLSVPEVLHGQRLDRALSGMMPEVSRGRIQGWIDAGRVVVDGAVAASRRVAVSEGQTVEVSPQFDPVLTPAPEAMALDIRHADAACLVIHKPVGLVVHPGAGNPAGTLLNGLLHHDPALDRVPRAGLVHRLDKDTSGLLVVARTPQAHHLLTQQLQARAMHREYLALVWGQMIAGGTVDAPIARHPTDRTRFCVAAGGRESVTHYRVEQRLPAHTLLRLKLDTGRTHQIRVHMQHLGFPLVGDPTYGRRGTRAKGMSDAAAACVAEFRHQALHATRLAFDSPAGARVDVRAPVPDDFQRLLEGLDA